MSAPWSEAMAQRAALRQEAIFLAIEGALQANKHHFVAKDGTITDERVVPDHDVRMKAVEVAAKLYNAFPAARLDVGGTIRVEQLYEMSETFAKALSRPELLQLAGLPADADVVEGEVVP